ncbi:Type IV fimbrial assembly protein PilC [Methylophaga frappieri]|uniref:Type IV fimbrial assembly protein PilC n=1 Tax=Methylophaga frappieri (strain ATCC BAA-2434 / DSM 25690 / JAM7) TaxID=754477 RepID=I1YKC0_METFJ|nr:type II secretion system F family protein [Methylophaga frappieri]AFJ03363.1 Type IV fimbrial assembly protein PilC [Methylophaga frappieri]
MAQAVAAKKKREPAPTLYLWQGTNKQGRRVKGQMTGEGVQAVRADLRRQGITPLKVRKKPKDLFAPRKPPIKPADIAIFSRMLATMMSSGVPLMQSMQIIGEGHENASMQEMILSIKADVESGTSLAESLSKFPLHFNDLYVSLVNAGEQSGTLEALLHEIATYQEKTEALKAKIRKALVYPAAIIVVAFIVTAILMIFVIPQFESLFTGFGADLPGLTKLVISISEVFQEKWWLIFGVLIGTVVGFMMAKKRSRKVQHFLDRLTLKLPVIGEVMTKGAIARFSRTFSVMFKAGVPMVDAMTSVAGATGNIVYTDATLAMRDDVATGTQLNKAMVDTELFPNMVIQMVAIGEESGSLDSMLAKVADFFEREVDDAVDNMTALLEPLIMAFLGVVVGTLVIAMYLPIFKLGAVV